MLKSLYNISNDCENCIWYDAPLNQKHFLFQVKIWFQNRRAKERKMIKKKISQFENSGGSVQSDSGSISPGELPNIFFTTSSAVHRFQPIEIQQVIVSE